MSFLFYMTEKNFHSPIALETLVRLPRINALRFTTDGTHFLRHETVNGQGKIIISGEHTTDREISYALDVRGGIGYGGGEFDVGSRFCVYSVNSDGLYLSELQPPFSQRQLTSHWQSTASACLSPDEEFVLFIYTDNEKDGVAVCDIKNDNQAQSILSSADFYMQLCWHPSQKLIAWVEWDHPYMPWQASRVKLGKFNPRDSVIENIIDIAGQIGQSASHPLFSPDGKWLSFIVRNGDWDNLLLCNIETGHVRSVVVNQESHLRLPEWVQGMRSYVWDKDSKFIYHFRYLAAETTLWKVDIHNGDAQQLDIHPITWAAQLDISPRENELVFLGSAATIPKNICRLKNNQLHRFSDEISTQLDSQNLHASSLKFPTLDGKRAHGLIYSANQSSKDRTRKALIVHVHGGPTAVAENGFNPDAAYFTSRGFAFAEINYRGSATFGYGYQDALEKSWGIVDVQDTIEFTEYLIKKGWCDPEKIFLFGSSAGGFTILNALIQKPGFFRAAICSYAVSDLLADAQSTHKFERYYHRFLTGELPKEREIFISRSPIHHVEKIQDPLLLFHGDQDRVVDVEQTISIHNALSSREIPCELIIYPGEGHGFRKFENIVDYYQRIEKFLLNNLE